MCCGLSIAAERLGEILRFGAGIRFEKTETPPLKPVKIIAAPEHLILPTRFGIKVNIAVVRIGNMFFLAGGQEEPAPGLPVFRFIFAG